MTESILERLEPCPFCGGEVEATLAKRDLAWIEHKRKDWCSVLDGVWASPEQWNARPEAAALIRELVRAGEGILARMFDRLSNGNGVEADDGEKCWIVHSDDIEELRQALSKVKPLSVDRVNG